jgi:hypothetical protein
MTLGGPVEALEVVTVPVRLPPGFSKAMICVLHPSKAKAKKAEDPVFSMVRRQYLEFPVGSSKKQFSRVRHR